MHNNNILLADNSRFEEVFLRNRIMFNCISLRKENDNFLAKDQKRLLMKIITE